MGSVNDIRCRSASLTLGTMHFGTATNEATSFAILNRYVEAGGTFIDTADNHAFWASGTQGGESEELLGRWRRSRGVGDEIVIATKLGARPLARGTSYIDNAEGLSAAVIRESAERSRHRLGLDRLNCYTRTSRIRRCRWLRPWRPSPRWWPRAPSACSA